MKTLYALFLIFIFSISNAQVSDFKAMDFTVANNIARLNYGSDLEQLPLLTHKLTYKLQTDVEKFRAIYTWICQNIKGDSRQENKILKKRKKLKNDSIGFIKWNTEYSKIAFKKLLKRKKTMCTGYAYLLKEMCFLANIECKIVNGYGRTVNSNVDVLTLANHSWNAVKLNNKWYLCDATWSSGYMIGKDYFINDYNDGYFLTDPKLFAKNHLPLNKKWLLDETLLETAFVTSPIVYGGTFRHKIIPIRPKKLNIIKKKNEEVTFSFKPLKNVSLSAVNLIQFNGTNEKAFKIYNLKNKDGIITFKYRFKYQGFHDIHLKVNNTIVSTYTVKVLKS